MAANEDQWRRRGHLFMVADGMGAHAAGELASKMSVDTVTLSYYKLPDASPADAIRKAVEEANAKIHSRGQANPDFKGMGTTTSALLLLAEGAVVAHVGDSRVYRLRGNRLEQLSFDHSLVWEMTASGKLNEQEVPAYIPKNIITRSLGPGETVQVDLEGPFPLADGDTFLLCSDGLSGPVKDEEIGVIMGTLPPQDAVRVLVDLANLRGGPDNITVLIAQARSVPPAAGPASSAPRPATSGRSANPIGWVVCGVLLLVTAVLAAVQQFPIAAATGIGAVIAAIVMFLRSVGGGSSGSSGMPSGRLGRGPHRSYICQVNQEFVDKLAKIVEPLREEAKQQQWDVEWTKFDALCKQATTAAARQDFTGAVRAYCYAISFLMQQLRGQRHKRAAGPAAEFQE